MRRAGRGEEPPTQRQGLTQETGIGQMGEARVAGQGEKAIPNTWAGEFKVEPRRVLSQVES